MVMDFSSLPLGKRSGPEPNICGFSAIKPDRAGVSDQEQWSDRHSHVFFPLFLSKHSPRKDVSPHWSRFGER